MKDQESTTFMFQICSNPKKNMFQVLDISCIRIKMLSHPINHVTVELPRFIRGFPANKANVAQKTNGPIALRSVRLVIKSCFGHLRWQCPSIYNSTNCNVLNSAPSEFLKYKSSLIIRIVFKYSTLGKCTMNTCSSAKIPQVITNRKSTCSSCGAKR